MQSSLFYTGPVAARAGFSLRDYQQADADEISRLWESGIRSVLCVHATGLGKSVLAAEMAHRRPRGTRALVVVDASSLATDLYNTIKRHTGETPGILTGPIKQDLDAEILVATKQCICAGDKYLEIDFSGFETMIVDECEAALANEYLLMLTRIVERCPDMKLMGMTATPLPAGNRKITDLFGYAAKEPGLLYRDLQWGYLQGWLVKPMQGVLRCSMDFSSLKVRKSDGEVDYTDKDIAKLMLGQDERQWIELAGGIYQIAEGKRAIVIVPNSTEVSDKLADYIEGQARERGRKNVAYSIHVNMSKNESWSRMRRFKADEFPIAVSCKRFEKGFDYDKVDMVIMARRTKSLRMYTQVAGRGTRPLKEIRDSLSVEPDSKKRMQIIAESAKPNCIAKGQRVLTDCGLVPIERVTIAMRVWDGFEFVSHRGVVCHGNRNVITYAGLTATPDHEVLSYDMYGEAAWKTLGDCEAEKAPVCVAGIGRSPVWEADGYYRRDCANEPRKRCDGGGQVCGVWGMQIQKLPVPKSRRSRLLSLWAPSPGTRMVVFSRQECVETMRRSNGQELSQLRRPRDFISVQVCHGDGYMGTGETRTAQGNVDRSDRQRWQLLSRELAVHESKSATMQSAAKKEASGVVIEAVQGLSSGDSLFRQVSQGLFIQGPDGTSDRREISAMDVKEKTPVYDIINAGPRRRFTVEGLIVHNCVVVDCVGIDDEAKDIIGVIDILGRGVRSDIKERVRKLMLEKALKLEEYVPQAHDVGELAREAIAEEAEEKRQEAERARIASEDRKRALRAMISASVDPELRVYECGDGPSGKWGKYRKFIRTRGTATPKQVKLLIALGVSGRTALSYNKGQAGAVISKYTAKGITPDWFAVSDWERMEGKIE